jgi:hypothetical protein
MNDKTSFGLVHHGSGNSNVVWDYKLGKFEEGEIVMRTVMV